MSDDCHDWHRIGRYKQRCSRCGKVKHENILHREVYEQAVKDGWLRGR